MTDRTFQQEPADARMRQAIRNGVGLLIFAAGVVLAGLVWVGTPDVSHFETVENFPVFLALTLCGFALLHLLGALRQGLSLRKFGAATLEAHQPVLGKAYRGKILTKTDVAATGPFVMKLRCEVLPPRSDDSADDTGHAPSRVLLWQGHCTAPDTTPSSLGIPFEFSIPTTGLSNDGEYASAAGTVYWTLDASAPTRGQNFHAAFPLQVARDEATGSPASAFAGEKRPEQANTRIFRWASTVMGSFFVLGGIFATIRLIQLDRADKVFDPLAMAAVGVVFLLISAWLWRRR